MFTRHVSEQLAAYVDGQLSPRDAEGAELHIRGCARCRDECEQVRFGMGLLEHLPPVVPPEAVWASIEAASRNNLARETLAREPLWNVTPPHWRVSEMSQMWRVWRMWPLAVAATVLVFIGAALWVVAHRSTTEWEVVRLDGSPAVGARHISGAGRIGAGEWIETDAGSRATIKIGAIGDVEVAPNTRIRVVTARPDEHRLALARGEIRAKISAPPRLFFVDTASGTAVDLGCEYSLNADENGFGLLQVRKGWVAFQWNGLESLVPGGASCQTRPQAGPGVPYFDDASAGLKEALASFTFEKAGDDVLSIILAESRVRDTLTLWHLLSRVNTGDRSRVYDRMAALTPVPAGVSRERVLILDPETLRRWKDELAWTW